MTGWVQVHEMVARPGWMRHAACAHRPDLPWSSDPAQVPAANRQAMGGVCARCPVLIDCDHHTPAGWLGWSPWRLAGGAA